MQSKKEVDELFDSYSNDDEEYSDEEDSPYLSFDDAIDIYMRTFPDEALIHTPLRKRSYFSSIQNAWSLHDEERHLCLVSASTLTAWKFNKKQR